MSIEAMKQAIEALEHAEKDSADFQRINTDQTSAAIAAPRTAIQQADGDDVYKPVPTVGTDAVINAWNDLPHSLRSDPLMGRVFDALMTCRDVSTTPAQAQGVPDDVMRDAERYRLIRDADVSDDLIPDIALYAMESPDEYRRRHARSRPSEERPAMTDIERKSQNLDIVRLLSALESWGFATNNRLPDYLRDDLCAMVAKLCAEILGEASA